MTAAKYRPGEAVLTVVDAVRHIYDGSCLYLPGDDAPKHPSFLQNLSIRTLSIRCGPQMRLAVPIERKSDV